jgi:hypothetical protein
MLAAHVASALNILRKCIGNMLSCGPSVSPDLFDLESLAESFESGKSPAAQSETYGNCLFFLIANQDARTHQTRCEQMRRAVPVIDQNVAAGEASTIERVIYRRVVHSGTPSLQF